MSLFVGLNTGLTAIHAAQAAIDTATHNVSNANTEGYTRQRVELAARLPFQSPVGPIGTGVDVTRVARLRDQFLDANARATSGEFSRLDVMAGLASQVEALTGEPDNGISGELTRLWNTFEDLAMDPSDPAVRRQALTQLDTVASKIRSVATAWDQLEADTTVRRDVTVTEVNAWLSEVAELNRQVVNSEPSKVSNDLLDRRDLVIDQLAEATGLRATAQADGTITLTLGSEDVVSGTTAGTVALSGTDITANGTVVTAAVRGELAGLHEFLATVLPTKRAELDAFATALADTVNTQHAAGYRADGTPGGALFAYDPTDPAGSIASTVTTTSQLAAAGALDPGTGLPGGLDGTNAQALADLRTVAPGGGTPLADQLNALVVDLGAQVAATKRNASAAGDLAVSAQVARQSQHGVSLDEETVDLVRYQRQLEAASRFMTAIDEALDALMRVGVVGR